MVPVPWGPELKLLLPRIKMGQDFYNSKKWPKSKSYVYDKMSVLIQDFSKDNGITIVKLMCTNFCMEQIQDPDIITVIAKQCLKQQRKGMHKNTLADNF